jgi:hypothetical protein
MSANARAAHFEGELTALRDAAGSVERLRAPPFFAASALAVSGFAASGFASAALTTSGLVPSDLASSGLVSSGLASSGLASASNASCRACPAASPQPPRGRQARSCAWPRLFRFVALDHRPRPVPALAASHMVALGCVVLAKRERVMALEPFEKGLIGNDAALCVRGARSRSKSLADLSFARMIPCEPFFDPA